MNRYQVTAKATPLGCGMGAFFEATNARDAVRKYLTKYPDRRIIERVQEFCPDGKQRTVPSSEY